MKYAINNNKSIYRVSPPLYYALVINFLNLAKSSLSENYYCNTISHSSFKCLVAAWLYTWHINF